MSLGFSPLLSFSTFLRLFWALRVGEFKIKLFMGGSQIDDSFVAVAAAAVPVAVAVATSAQIASIR